MRLKKMKPKNIRKNGKILCNMEGRRFHVAHTFLFPHLKKNGPKKYKLYVTWNDALASVIGRKKKLLPRFIYGVATVSRIDKIIGLFCKRFL